MPNPNFQTWGCSIKSADRMAQAKTARDSHVSDVHHAQPHDLGIRASAEVHLAEEYKARTLVLTT